MRVLIIEDHPADRQLIRALLRTALDPVDIVEAGSLREASARLATGGLDLVLLDLNLPDSTDIETVRRVVHAAPDLPVVVLTGEDDEKRGLEAIAHGAQDYLAKDHLLLQHTGLEAVLLRRAARHAIERHRLRRESRYDPLTGVFNRRGLTEALDREADRCLRADEPLCALLVDCDDFKSINQRYGYNGGDDLLKMVAHCGLGTLRPSDIVARFGGDEFVALLPGLSCADAQSVAERLCACVAEHAARWEVTVSVGVVRVDLRHARLDDIVAAAQRGLRTAKRLGKNQASVAPAEQVAPPAVA